ncbi:hypothetical protein PIB30_083947 [Stylosanthes scabra]|uniref:Uncharacterized protein n=1 Tax=Stylosanthes scabra TaxID=79078 RepID=A0ABU6RSL6_9FABA|nr:hypothetical protein [Stylosanthes scabra]
MLEMLTDGSGYGFAESWLGGLQQLVVVLQWYGGGYEVERAEGDDEVRLETDDGEFGGGWRERDRGVAMVVVEREKKARLGCLMMVLCVKKMEAEEGSVGLARRLWVKLCGGEVEEKDDGSGVVDVPRWWWTVAMELKKNGGEASRWCSPAEWKLVARRRRTMVMSPEVGDGCWWVRWKRVLFGSEVRMSGDVGSGVGRR